MKVPKQAKRVFKGEIFNVYQWEQKMFDDSCATFEILKRPGTVEVITVIDDKILMCEQEQPTEPLFYSLFGGRMNKGEKPLDAIKRELLEESGYQSDDWELIKSYDPYHKMEWTISTFVARNCKKISEQDLEAGERIKIMVVSFDKFLDIVDSEKFRGRDFSDYVFRMKQDKERLEEFKRRLFD